MKLAWITDVHLNFMPRHYDLRRDCRMLPWPCDAILVGGDTAEAEDLAFWLTKIADTLGEHRRARG